MPDFAIRVENLSKRFNRFSRGADTIREALWEHYKKLWHGMFGRQSPDEPALSQSKPEETFWALKDISFEIPQGACWGIIGRNGAGKTTLFKIFTRITEPTSGRVTVCGSISGLLGVGIGLHQDLTGRENIYLSGLVLGLRQREIQKQFDEIVDFAEIEPFLDTPLKFYSSGMRVRLGFSVASHLQSDILVVDDGLAVGDLAFQQKCLEKMRKLKQQEGRTTILVSHSMNQIRTFCHQAVFLHEGRVKAIGAVDDVVDAYVDSIQVMPEGEGGVLYECPGKNRTPERFQVLQVTILDESGSLKDTVRTWDYLRLRIRVNSPFSVTDASAQIRIAAVEGDTTLMAYSTSMQGYALKLAEGQSDVDCVFPKFPLLPGKYSVKVSFTNQASDSRLCVEEGIAPIVVSDQSIYRPTCGNLHDQGSLIAVEHFWESIPGASA